MSAAFECNRCGKLFKDFSSHKAKIGNILILRLIYKDLTATSLEKDLCPECAESFVKWFSMKDEPRNYTLQINSAGVIDCRGGGGNGITT